MSDKRTYEVEVECENCGQRTRTSVAWGTPLPYYCREIRIECDGCGCVAWRRVERRQGDE